MIDPLFLTIFSTFLFLLIFVYFPGMIISKVMGLFKWWDFHCAVGITVLMLVLFFGRFVLPTSVILAIYLLIIMMVAYFKKIKPVVSIRTPNLFITLSIVMGTVTMAWSYLVTILKGKDAVLYEVYIGRDQSWHAALISELSQHFPPQVPGFAGEILKNYHYFMDILIAANYQLLGGDIAFYIQVTYPLIFALFFGISVYRIISLFTQKTWVKSFTILLAYMGNNLSFFLPLIGFSVWQSDSFFLDQPVVYLGNHQTVLSLALFFYFLILLISSLKKPRIYSYSLMAGVILASLMKVKIYAFVVAAFLFGVWGIWHLVLFMKNRNAVRIKSLLAGSLTAGILSIAIYLLSFNSGKQFIVYEPGWLLQVFYERALYPIWPWFKHHYMAYKVAGNPKYYVLHLVVILLFIILNLGVRIIGIGYLAYKKQRILSIFLLLSAVFIFVILLLTRQSTGGFNIIQFGPYAVCSLVILTGGVFARSRWPKSVIIPLAVIVILVSIPVTIKALLAYTPGNFQQLDTESIAVLDALRSQPEGVTAVIGNYPSINSTGGGNGNNTVGAVGHHRAYLIDKVQIEVLDFDWKERDSNLKQLETHWCNFDSNDKALVQKGQIKYFLIPSQLNCRDNNLISLSEVYRSTKYALVKVE